MRGIVICAFSCMFLGCTWNTELEPINHTILLHDNSSKVWLVDQMLIGDRDYTPLQMEYKEVIVFHENSSAYFYRLKEFGQKRGKRMSFWMNEGNKEFSFVGAKKDLLFEIVYLTRKKIRLKPKNNSYKYELVLIPFPEY